MDQYISERILLYVISPRVLHILKLIFLGRNYKPSVHSCQVVPPEVAFSRHSILEMCSLDHKRVQSFLLIFDDKPFC